MLHVGIASSSQLAADAAAGVARAGGNAVDAAVTAALVQTVTEPGLASLGGSGFVTIWPPDDEPLTVEGAAEMPGRQLPEERFRRGVIKTRLAWGGGMDINVGPGTVATYGILAALGLAAERWSARPWRELAAPALALARSGFAFSPASQEFMAGIHEGVFGWNQASLAPLLTPSGALRPSGDHVVFEHLGESMAAISAEGPGALYTGPLARTIAEHVSAAGGILTAEDLAAYRPEAHESVRVELGRWSVASSPPPSRGGAEVAAMMMMLAEEPPGEWGPEELERLIQIQRSVMEHRQQVLDPSDDLPRDVARLLEQAARGKLPSRPSSCTVHTSTVDTGSLACAVTLTAGYGSGVMAPGTGIWLNNSLGELELNPRGIHSEPPGTRLASSMAPTVARADDGAVLALGSPGSQRITTAVVQTLANFLFLGLPLRAAVEHPRLHVELTPGFCGVAHEEGLPLRDPRLPVRRFPPQAMFFGGVNAALLTADGAIELVSDPRRRGGTAITS